ncbi:hypothetical protein [Frigidibacter sp. ROC022]|uniref:hypothetical protein n=1 Tax=Frigidibacter sp. ROC022 TaxID=2971796 RepID=UPI00215B1823|nr:hypothetical protein [Frigidibacter sp. ROC022]MCR8723960.1 hypothetical protein [Frigidibacter sp. ROC022]
MTIARLTAILGVCLLTACGFGQSRFNPLNWFGPSENRVQLIPEGGFTTDNDKRSMIERVTELTIEPVIGGALVRATGLPPVQGYWDGELVSTNDFTPEKGVLLLEFRIAPPVEPTAVSTPQSREVVVGLFLSRQKLDGVREIRVLGLANSRSLRR